MNDVLLPPVHPGEVLREEFMRPLGLTVEALAQAMGTGPDAVRALVSEVDGISADMVRSLAQYFGTTEQSWLNLQRRYEEECARRRAATGCD